MYRHAGLEQNPCLRLIAVENGGHLGFLAQRGARFWLDAVIVQWLTELREAV
jgi:predicted alpha/beta-fold hydrolase